jgi:hypothetical protein
MEYVRNVLEIPPPAPMRDMPSATSTDGPARRNLSGALSNGQTRVFAELQPGVSGTSTIRFSVELNSVTEPAFTSWCGEITEILGADIEGKIATFSSVANNPDQPEKSASKYALATYSYISTGVFSSFGDKSNVPFGPPVNGDGRKVLASIHGLESRMIRLGGTLQATIQNPRVEAFVYATYFSFGDGVVTSFVGYSGEVILVDGGREVLTPPGVLVVL